MKKPITLLIDETIYDGLVRVVGRGRMSWFVEKLVEPYVLKDDLLSAYQEMAADTERETAALDWSNSLIGDSSHAAR